MDFTGLSYNEKWLAYTMIKISELLVGKNIYASRG